MKGIELKVDETSKTGLINSDNYTLSLCLTIRKFDNEEQISLIFSGYDRDKDKQLEFFADHYFGKQINQEIKIKLIDGAENISAPIKEIPYDESSNNEMLLKSYRKLEETLKSKGLI